MAFKFDIILKPKKRGNWRPEVIITLEILAPAFPHRPYVPRLHIVSINMKDFIEKGIRPEEAEWFWPVTHEKPFKIISRDKWFLDLSDLARDSSDNLKEDCTHAFHDSPKRGVEAAYPLTGGDIGPGGFLEVNYRHDLHLFLPWRPGIRPDYSDYMARFENAGRWFAERLKDGEDSGQNDEMIISVTSARKKSREQGVRKLRF